MTFTKAIKRESKLRMAIAGPSGSGKTYTALAIASALANGKSVAMVDTEHGSASKYADLFQFDVLEMHPPYHPDRFVEAINEAAKAGYGVVILDSLTHAWSGTGGLLEVVDQIAARMRSQNSFAAWKDATPIQNRLVEAIVAAPLHVIATMRSKQEYVVQQDERGKQAPRKVGMAPQQREGFEYEFDVFGEMDIDNTMIVTKSRCPALSGAVIKKPGADVAAILTTWLRGVAQATPQAQAITQAPAPVIAQAEPTNGDSPAADDDRPTSKQVRMFHATGRRIYGREWEEIGRAMVADTCGSPHTTDLTRAQMSNLIDMLVASEASMPPDPMIDSISHLTPAPMSGAQATAELFGPQ